MLAAFVNLQHDEIPTHNPQRSPKTQRQQQMRCITQTQALRDQRLLYAERVDVMLDVIAYEDDSVKSKLAIAFWEKKWFPSSYIQNTHMHTQTRQPMQHRCTTECNNPAVWQRRGQSKGWSYSRFNMWIKSPRNESGQHFYKFLFDSTKFGQKWTVTWRLLYLSHCSFNHTMMLKICICWTFLLEVFMQFIFTHSDLCQDESFSRVPSEGISMSRLWKVVQIYIYWFSELDSRHIKGSLSS